MSDKNCLSLYIPKGFAHAYYSYEKSNIVYYKLTNYYKPNFESGINAKDKDLKIKWPKKNVVLSKKDRKLLTFKEFKKSFKIFNKLMTYFKLFCLCLESHHLQNIKYLNYIPVGLGQNKFSKEWLTDDKGENISVKNPFMLNIHFIIGYGKIDYLNYKIMNG